MKHSYQRRAILKAVFKARGEKEAAKRRKEIKNNEIKEKQFLLKLDKLDRKKC